MLAIKDVEFNNALIRACEDDDGQIWVGVGWMCKGLGLSEDRMKYERKKMQRDVVLREGVKFYPLHSGADVLCMHLDFVPLWLAKISITPMMRREDPELVKNLITYQLEAKNVLAAAFLKKPDTTDKRLDELAYKVDQLYNELSKLVTLLLPNTNNTTPVLTYDPSPSPSTEWKRDINVLCNQITETSADYSSKRELLIEVYARMRNVYGIVWEQELKELAQRTCTKVSKLDVVYNNDMYRSIFESILKDRMPDERRMFQPDVIIAPLLYKRDDHSPHGSRTYRVVYDYMYKHYDINWDKHKRKQGYKNNASVKKMTLIEADRKLQGFFEKSVQDLLKG